MSGTSQTASQKAGTMFLTTNHIARMNSGCSIVTTAMNGNHGVTIVEIMKCATRAVMIGMRQAQASPFLFSWNSYNSWDNHDYYWAKPGPCATEYDY